MTNTVKPAVKKEQALREFYKTHEYVQGDWVNGEYVLGKWVKKE